jgi:hypothetical protein
VIGEAVIGALGGGLLRLAPEVLSFFDRQRDRDHELAMQTITLQAHAANPSLAKAGAVGGDLPPTAMSTLIDSIRDQYRATGTKIDWISILVRPATTYSVVALYLGMKACFIVAAYLGHASLAEFGEALQR